MSDSGPVVVTTEPTVAAATLPPQVMHPSESQVTALPGTRPASRDRRHAWSWARTSLVADVLMLATADFMARLVLPSSTPSVFWTLVFSLLTLQLLYARGMYRPPFHLQVIEAGRVVVTASALALTIAISLRVAFTDASHVPAQSALFWLFAAGFLIAGRIVLVSSPMRVREAGVPTLVVGAGKVGRLVAKRLREHPELGLAPVGFLDKEPLFSGDETVDLPVLGASWDLERIVDENEIGHVVVTFSTAPTEVLLGLLKRCEQLGIQASFVPRLFERSTERSTVARLGGIPLISFRSSDPRSWRFAVKYTLDRIAAAFALVLLAPIMGALAVAVWISLGRPILFRQERVGRDGSIFEMFKFRSMHAAVGPDDADVVASTELAPGGVEGDDRRTRVGAIIRRTSLDELPQLFNVIKGDMSFVGPRPERPAFVEIFDESVHRYDERHRVKPGITGWAQVSGLRGKTSLVDRAEWDSYYIENWSLWLDFKIFLLTLVAVARPADVE